MHPRTLCLALLVLAITSVQAQLPPDKAASTFKVSDGLEMKLWASEPLFVNPTCMDVDHRGRVWVCESVNYRNKLRGMKKLTRAEGDRIVILEDEKGEGKATKATTFYQSPATMAPLGIAVAPHPRGPGVTVFVCQSPDILVFEDHDGDGKADGPPKKLLTGFRGIDHDHGVHSVLIGPDNRLYFTVGDSGVGGLRPSDGKGRTFSSNNTTCRAGTVWRCELDGTRLELLAHNFRNNYEVCVDSFGTMFLSDNDDDGNQQTRICHVIPGGDYGYHPRGKGESHWHEERPGVMPKILRTYFGSPTGMCVYEGKLLPKKYHGQLLHTDAGPRHVRAYHLRPKGASYEVDREDMVTSKDDWFRPSDVCVGPDGSVYVADWYDGIVGGHALRDTKMGRIYRLAPKGHAAKGPPMDLSSDKGVLAALGSPNLATRAAAMAKLDLMKKPDALKLLEPAGLQKEDAVLRARALWQLARIGGYDHYAKSKALRAGVDDADDPRFLALGIRLGRDFLKWNDRTLAGHVRAVKRVFKAPTSVLREGLSAMRDSGGDAVKEAIYDLMKDYDGKDRHYLACVGIAVGHHDKARRDEILADFGKHFPVWDERTAGLAWELRPPGIVALLEKRLADEKVSEGEKAKLVDAIADTDDKRGGAVLLAALKDAGPKVRERILTSLRLHLPSKWSHLKSEAGLRAAADLLLKAPETRVAGLELLAATERDAEAALPFATAKEQPEVRRAALAVLARSRSLDTMAELVKLTGDADEPFAGEAVLALGEMARQLDGKSGEAAAAVRKIEGHLSGKPVLRDAAVVALAASRPGSERLLALHGEKKLPAEALAAAGRMLRASPYPDLQKKARVAFPAPGKIDPKSLPTIAELARRKGDAKKGKTLYEASLKNDLACARCHTVQGKGGQVGPDLSMIGKKLAREGMLEAILFPSKGIADQYIVHVIQTAKGVTVQGLLIEDTAAGVVLRDAEGRDTRIAAADIEKREKSPKSIMPEDVVAHMTPDELTDLVEYLLTLKSASYTVGQWHIAGPFEGNIDAAHGPDKAIDLKATYAGKGGKVAWRAVRPGATGYVDLGALYGAAGADSVSYLVADIESPAEQDADLLIGSDDGCKVFLDGKLVHTSRETRAATPDQARVKVRLKKGVNRVLFKIDNGNNPHGLYFSVASEQELKAPGGK